MCGDTCVQKTGTWMLLINVFALCSAAAAGDGGGAEQDTQWTGAQRDSGQIQRSHQPHETTGEETQT